MSPEGGDTMHSQAAIAVFLLAVLSSGPAGDAPPPPDGSLLPKRPPRVATFKLKSEFSLDIPAGSRQVRIWLPLPQADDASPHLMVRDSKVTNLRIVSDHAHRIETDSEGNTILYVELTNPSVARFELSYTFDLTRTETYGGSVNDEGARPYTDADRESLARHLQPTRHLIAGSPRIKALGAKIVGGESNPARKVRRIYDWMLANVDYWVKHPDTKSASPIGDAEWCLDTGAGNCSDFHATFASLARSQGIATRQTYGGLLKAELNGQAVDAGYHCWSETYLPGLGWVVSDVAVADLWNSDNLNVEKLNEQARVRLGRTAGSNYTAGHNARAVEYYFGNMDERRVLWSFGRDIVLSPPQAGPPVNNMLRGYFEIDGRVAPEWSWDASTLRRRFSYEAVDAPVGPKWPVE
jgi:transglutaminase-like putative cysteine protease